MTRHAISLGRIAGIDIRLDYSWFLIIVLLSWMLARSYYPAEMKGGSLAQYWVMGVVTAILLFVSVLLILAGAAALFSLTSSFAWAPLLGGVSSMLLGTGVLVHACLMPREACK